MLIVKKSIPYLVTAFATVSLAGCASHEDKMSKAQQEPEVQMIGMKTESDVKNVSADKAARFSIDSTDDNDKSSLADNDDSSVTSEPVVNAEPENFTPVTKTVYFDFDSANLNQDAMETLKSIPDLDLKKEAKLKVEVTGYTDAVGPEDYNQQLSLQRAKSVEAALTKQVNDYDLSIDTQGMGEAEPAMPNDSAHGREMNRRVTVTINSPSTKRNAIANQ